jgi:hypothetical protein
MANGIDGEQLVNMKAENACIEEMKSSAGAVSSRIRLVSHPKRVLTRHNDSGLEGRGHETVEQRLCIFQRAPGLPNGGCRANDLTTEII